MSTLGDSVYCPDCKGHVFPCVDIKVEVWQRANGTLEGKMFVATDCETLYESEVEIKRELACPNCGNPIPFDGLDLEWS